MMLSRILCLFFVWRLLFQEGLRSLFYLKRLTLTTSILFERTLHVLIHWCFRGWFFSSTLVELRTDIIVMTHRNSVFIVRISLIRIPLYVNRFSTILTLFNPTPSHPTNTLDGFLGRTVQWWFLWSNTWRLDTKRQDRVNDLSSVGLGNILFFLDYNSGGRIFWNFLITRISNSLFWHLLKLLFNVRYSF